MSKPNRPSIDYSKAIDLDALGVDVPTGVHAPELEPSRLKRAAHAKKKKERRTPEARRSDSELMELEAMMRSTAFRPLVELTMSHWSDRQPGRPPSTTPTTVVVGTLATKLFQTQRAGFRELNDRQHWERLGRLLQTEFPHNPEMWLPPKSPSRDAHRRARLHLGAKYSAQFRAITRTHGLAVYRTVIASESHPYTRPTPANAIYGDMVEVRARTDFAPGTFGTRPDGSTYPHVADPQAGPITDTATVAAKRLKAPTDRSTRRARGLKLVRITMRNRHGNEKLDLDTVEVPPGKGDGEVFVDWVIEHRDEFPDVTIAIYDMALRGSQAQRLVAAGVIPMTKIPLTRKHRWDTATIGVENFKLADGTVEHIAVSTFNGQAGITVSAAGRRFFAALIRAQIRKRNNTVYMETTVPHLPQVPQRLRGARCLLRLNSTDKELEAGINRAAHLRAFPENDATFKDLFGLREDAESGNNKLKTHLWGKRARTANPDENSLDLAVWQLLENTRALKAFNTRLTREATGPPLSASG